MMVPLTRNFLMKFVGLSSQVDIIKHLKFEETSKGSIINEEQHESLIHAPMLDEKPKLRDPLSNHTIKLENHFGL